MFAYQPPDDPPPPKLPPGGPPGTPPAGMGYDPRRRQVWVAFRGVPIQDNMEVILAVKLVVEGVPGRIRLVHHNLEAVVVVVVAGTARRGGIRLHQRRAACRQDRSLFLFCRRRRRVALETNIQLRAPDA